MTDYMICQNQDNHLLYALKHGRFWFWDKQCLCHLGWQFQPRKCTVLCDEERQSVCKERYIQWNGVWCLI